ncbi:MAG: amino acid ABC transporter permease [Eubacteriales bacterium]|nr:amino acid ABC transporter permease [Eubacteriales bacterium]
MSYTFSFDFINKYGQFFVNGLIMTLELSLFAVLLGTVFGTLMGLCRVSSSKILKFLSAVYVEFTRGTPLLVQLYLFRYGLIIAFPSLSKMSVFIPCIIALAFNSTAYVAEIMRAGINAVDVGQMEAGRSLGMTRSQVMRRVILPQAYRNILPALGNEFVAIIKESSICSVVGVFDLMYMADLVRAGTARPFEPLMVAAMLYLCLTFPLSKLIGYLERRMKKGEAA